MYTVLAIFQVLICLFLILMVLLQTGKGADIGAVFGGGSTQTLFGARGAQTFIGKLTTICAVIFMTNSIVLAYLSSSRDSEFKELEEKDKAEQAEVVDQGGMSSKEENKEKQEKAAKDETSENVEQSQSKTGAATSETGSKPDAGPGAATKKVEQDQKAKNQPKGETKPVKAAPNKDGPPSDAKGNHESKNPVKHGSSGK